MARHLFKSSFGQCECRWCGMRRLDGDCPVTDDIRRRLKVFAATQGRNWKAALRLLWLRGEDEGLLRQARNTIGPSGLDRISPRLLDRVEVTAGNQ
jgi:hypothetical protein